MMTEQTPSTWSEAALVMLYCARWNDIENTIQAARLVSGHRDWPTFGGRELAIVASGYADESFCMMDLAAVPEARDFAVVIVINGEVTWRRQ